MNGPDVRKMTFSCRVQRKSSDSRTKNGPIKSIMFAIDSSGVDIDRTINLASGNSVISLI